MAVTDIVVTTLYTHPLLLASLFPLCLCIYVLYQLSPIHPLYYVPGPVLPRITPLWLVYHAWKGDECTSVHALHQRYGTIVRTGPHSVHISSGTALHDIYSGSTATKTSTTGFLKPTFYANFDIDGHPSIFSALDPAHRAVRAKAVTGIFSTTALRKGQSTIDTCVQSFIARLRREKERALARTDETTRGRVDLLNVSRGLAIDTVTSYLFGEAYGGCEEDIQDITIKASTDKKNAIRPSAKFESDTSLTASGMVDAFVAVGRIWYLPPWAFSVLNWIFETINPDPNANASLARVDEFVTSLVAKTESQLEQQKQTSEDEKTPPSTDTYQSRLLTTSLPTSTTTATKLTPSEVVAQCKDLVFAGTDSTAMNLATILHALSHPLHQQTTLPALKREILDNDDGPADDDPQTLPLLRATVREGLRLAMANPSRLPRLVPPGGWTFVDDNSRGNQRYHLPADTLVGCSTYELHFNPDVFADPLEFKPSRWLNDNDNDDDGDGDGDGDGDDDDDNNSNNSNHKSSQGDLMQKMNRDFFPFSAGPRQCIARNLATVELFRAVREVVRSGLMEGSRPVRDHIDILQWFNSKVIGSKIEVEWAQ